MEQQKPKTSSSSATEAAPKSKQTRLSNDLSNSSSLKAPQDFLFTNHINHLSKVNLASLSHSAQTSSTLFSSRPRTRTWSTSTAKKCADTINKL
jgi:hypothetical protein